MDTVPEQDSPLREEISDLVASLCKALGDAKRLLLLYALGDGPLTVSQLCEVIDAPQANTSQHLAVLRERGLVEATRQGNHVVYTLLHPKILTAVDMLRDIRAAELDRRQGLASR